MSTDIGHDVLLVPLHFPTIQAALDAVVRPSTIMVGPGVYAEDLRVVGTPNVVISTTRFGRRGVTLQGVGAATVLHVENATVYLSGIEIRSDGRARAIAAIDSSIALQECVLAGNRADAARDAGRGAAMLCLRASVRVQKSMLAGNSAHATTQVCSGGGLHLVDCKVEIAGSSIQANAAYGGDAAQGAGVYAQRCQLRLWRSRVTENALYGATCAGAGLYLDDCAAQIGGSVVTGNGTAEGTGGGIFIDGDPARIAIHRNSIVRQNHPDDVVRAVPPANA